VDWPAALYDKIAHMKIQITTSLLNCVMFSLLAGSAVGQEKAVEVPLREKEVVIEASGEATTATLAGRRDLAKYAEGGHFYFKSFIVKPAERSEHFSKLAKFLIEKLAENQLAYVRATYVGVDAGATYHYFIEPDRDGRWAVTTRMVGWHALPNGERIVDFPKAYRLQKVEHDSVILEIKFFGKSNQEIERLRIR
jgi:hypothetical protein